MQNDTPPGHLIHSVAVGNRKLNFYKDSISLGEKCLQLDDVDSLRVIRTDTYVNGAWIDARRIVKVGAGNESLTINCSSSRSLPDREKLERRFSSVMIPIHDIIGSRLINRFLNQLANGLALNIGGVEVTRQGVWVAGNWKFLWWEAKPRFVPWDEVRIWSDEGILFLGSNSDRRFRSEIDINETDNALVLDGMVRFLLERNNWKSFQK